MIWFRVLQFLVDHRPAKFAGAPHLNEGDRVTVAGRDFRSEFRALALRNDSTGVEYPGPVASYIGLALLGLAVGAACAVGLAYILSRLSGGFAGFPLFMASFITMPMLLNAGSLLFHARQNARANQTLRATPPLSAARAEAVGQSALGAAAANSTDGTARSLARFLGGILGMVLIIAASLATAATISTIPSDLHIATIIVGLALSIGVGVTGLALVRWGLGPR